MHFQHYVTFREMDAAGVRRTLNVVLICISLVAGVVEESSLCLLAGSISPFAKCPFIDWVVSFV